MERQRPERVAENEAIFRFVNEAIAQGHASYDLKGLQEYMCECGDARCTERLLLASDEYERIRANPLWFFVVSGHDVPEVEEVVEEADRYTIVEKFGVAAHIAEERDPRRPETS